MFLSGGEVFRGGGPWRKSKLAALAADSCFSLVAPMDCGAVVATSFVCYVVFGRFGGFVELRVAL